MICAACWGSFLACRRDVAHPIWYRLRRPGESVWYWLDSGHELQPRSRSGGPWASSMYELSILCNIICAVGLLKVKSLFKQFSSSYYYLHINKTGGSSLNRVFRGMFPKSLICPAGLARDLVAIPSNKLSTYRYYSGHFGLCLPVMLPLVKRLRLRTFTIIRDPVDRSLSQLNAYFRAKQNNYCSDFVRSVQCDVTKCLQNDRIVGALSNYQAKSLAVSVRLDQSSLIQKYGGSFQEFLGGVSCDLTEDELLRRALRSLENFCFVGLTEKMDESYKCLSSMLGMPSLDCIPQVNVSGVNPLTGSANSLSRADVSSAVIGKLEEINKIDLRLYERVIADW